MFLDPKECSEISDKNEVKVPNYQYKIPNPTKSYRFCFVSKVDCIFHIC